MTMWRSTAVLAGLLGLAAVILAAVGAHVVPEDARQARRLWSTALQMHLFHAAGLLGVAALVRRSGNRILPWAGILQFLGIALFSGSLYLRAAGLEWIPGPLTPLGGGLLIAGWIVLLVGLLAGRTV